MLPGQTLLAYERLGSLKHQSWAGSMWTVRAHWCQLLKFLMWPYGPLEAGYVRFPGREMETDIEQPVMALRSHRIWEPLP